MLEKVVAISRSGTERNGMERNNGLKCGTAKSWNMEGKGSNCMCTAGVGFCGKAGDVKIQR